VAAVSASLALTVPPPSAADSQARASGPTVVASGLDNPRQLSFARNGALYVAEAGTGGSGGCFIGVEGETCYGRSGAITRVHVRAGVQRRVIGGLPSVAPEGGGGALGPTDVVVGKRKRIAVTIGLGHDPRERAGLGNGSRRLATLLTGRLGGGGFDVRADMGAFEINKNPHRVAIDSNPVAVVRHGRGFVVVDAGGNTVVKVGPHGKLRLLAVFQNRVVAPGTEAQPVPTSVAVGPDGALYISQLTGFPFVPGAANIYRLVPGERPTVFARGLTNVTDLAWHHGRLYAVQIADEGLLSVPPGQLPMGSLRRINPSGDQHLAVVDELAAPYGVALRRGKAYVTTCAVCPDGGQVMQVSLDR
jgi:hypothetical protein